MNLTHFYSDQPQELILFYRSNGKYGFLSNLYKCDVEFEGRVFPTSEHAYQYGKIRDEKTREWVMQAPRPHLVPAICHGLFAFDIVDNWSKIKVERMLNVLRAKFSQNEDLKQKLLDTGNNTLIEDSKFDSFWGWGKNGKGKNMLGKLLMQVREELQKQEVSS